MQKLEYVLLVCVSTLLYSCGKAPLTNGDTITQLGTIDSTFRVVMLYDNVDIVLRHADDNHAKGSYQITTGANLINNIKIENPIHAQDTSYDTITIRNYNVLNWMRPYDYELKLTLYYDSISEIVFNSNGSLDTDLLKGVVKKKENSVDTWGFGDRCIKLSVNGGSGDINLRVDCYQLDTDYAFGTAKVFISGRSPITTTYCNYNCHGPIDARNLWTNYHYINHYGTNYVYAFARHQISAHNYNNGVIYYMVNTEQHLPETLDTIGSNIQPLPQ